MKPGASAEVRFAPPDSGFNLYLPRAGATDASQQGRGLFGPIIVDEAAPPDVDLDAAIVLSDWSLEASGRLKDDFDDPAAGRGSGPQGRPRLRQWRGRATEAQRPARRAGAPEARQTPRAPAWRRSRSTA